MKDIAGNLFVPQGLECPKCGNSYDDPANTVLDSIPPFTVLDLGPVHYCGRCNYVESYLMFATSKKIPIQRIEKELE